MPGSPSSSTPRRCSTISTRCGRISIRPISTSSKSCRDKVANGETATYSCRVELPNLGRRNVQIVAAPAIDDNGQHTGTVVIVRDMNDEVGRRKEMERFRAVADATTDLVAIASFGDGTNYLNPAGERFFGANPLNRNDTLKFIPEEYRETMFAEIGEAIRDGGTWSGEIEMVDQDGERHPMSGVAVGIRDEQGHLEGFAVTYRDLSDRKRLEARLAHDAGHDALTGLPNRQQLFHLLTNTIGDRERMAVMFCDLDDFKVVNDSLGHSVGDRLLQVVADRLQTATRGGDIVGRLGGDEFLVVCRNIGTDLEVAAIADRLLSAVKAPISLDGREHVVSMSVGVAFGIGSDPANEIVQRADLAMYAAKQAGRRRVALFDQTMRRQVDDRLDMERELRAAFRDNQLSLHYQPIVNTGTREVLGFEALVRWQHPTRGLILPGKFMPIIETAGFSIQLGEFVLNEATRAASLLRLRSPNLSMSINLSAAELNNGDLVENVAKAITRAGIGASALTIEITEDIVMSDIVAAKPQLDELHGARRAHRDRRLRHRVLQPGAAAAVRRRLRQDRPQPDQRSRHRARRQRVRPADPVAGPRAGVCPNCRRRRDRSAARRAAPPRVQDGPGLPVCQADDTGRRSGVRQQWRVRTAGLTGR